MSVYNNVGVIRLDKRILYNKNLMTQIFSHNGLIVLDCQHDAFSQMVRYSIQWDKLPEVPEGQVTPTYNIMYEHNIDGDIVDCFMDVGGERIKFATNNGLVINLSNYSNDSKIFYKGTELKNVTKLEIKAEYGELTKAILEIIPDKVIVDGVEEVKMKKRKVVL